MQFPAMNLLETVLCTADANDYKEQFMKYNINASTLKILTDEDLRLLGVDDGEKRLKILENAAKLQITPERKTDVIINLPYVQLVLQQMSSQLNRHLAAISIAVNRSEVAVCNVKLSPAVMCLESCLTTLENQLGAFEQKYLKEEERGINQKTMIFSAIITASLCVISFKLGCRIINRISV